MRAALLDRDAALLDAAGGAAGDGTGVDAQGRATRSPGDVLPPAKVCVLW